MISRIALVFLVTLISLPVCSTELVSKQKDQIVMQENYSTGAEDASNDCCWDKVEFDRPLQPYKPAVGPECCWMPVFGEIYK